MWVWRWISMVASAHHTHLHTWSPAVPWAGCGDGYIYHCYTGYEYLGTVWLCTRTVTQRHVPWISTRTTTLWRQLGAVAMTLADPCSTTGWIYTTGVLDAADLVINWQLAYSAGSSGYRRYMTLA